ncbi:MAG: DUF1638 domain-containing protein [Thermodesulfobacteriota bacterium]
MGQGFSKITCIACSTFRGELERLCKNGIFHLPVHYLDSELHAAPIELCRRLDGLLKDVLGHGKRVLLLYGECHPYMHEQESMRGVERVHGANCCEIMLGREKYRTLCKEGAFFLMPEWAKRGLEILQTQLKMSSINAKQFMQDMHTKLVYLDTGVMPAPTEELKEISDYTGLPCEFLRITHDPLLAGICEAMERVI